MSIRKTASLVLAALLLMSFAAQAATIDQVVVDKPVRNIIMMIPDGMSSDAVTLARWYRDGKALHLDEMASGMMKTYSADAAVADSAPAGTAMATGHKSHTGFVGVLPDEVTMPGLTPLQEGDQRRPVASILEAARLLNKSTGLIATSEIMHATPAAFSAHDASRKNYDALSEQQAHQQIDVVLGAGSKFFSAEGRKDGDDLLPMLKEKYQYVTTPEEMAAVTSGKLWGMFADSSMAYDFDRDASKEPSLAEMTRKAIELLNQNEHGFFLMVEGSKVDWAAHANDTIGIISDVLAFDDAVGVALAFAKEEGNTLVIAATDHGNSGITIGNRNTSGDYDKRPLSDFMAPIMRAKLTGEGLVQKLNEDRSNAGEVLKQYYGIEDATEEEIAAVKAAEAGSMNYVVAPMMADRANIGYTTGGHTGGDVTLYVYAPEGISQLTGTPENSDIARYMEKAFQTDLKQVTERLFVRAKDAFAQKGAEVVLDESDAMNPQLVVTKGDKELRLTINRNLALLNGQETLLEGVVVNSGEVFVPQMAVDLMD